MKSALSMCCFIEQSDSDAYMQPSSSRMFAPAVNTSQSDAQLKNGKVLKNPHQEFVATRNKFCKALGATSNVQLWSAQHVLL